MRRAFEGSSPKAKHRTHRTHSIAFKRQVVQEYLAGETLHGLARRHDLSRTLIRIWVDKYEAGAFDEDASGDPTDHGVVLRATLPCQPPCATIRTRYSGRGARALGAERVLAASAEVEHRDMISGAPYESRP